MERFNAVLVPHVMFMWSEDDSSGGRRWEQDPGGFIFLFEELVALSASQLVVDEFGLMGMALGQAHDRLRRNLVPIDGMAARREAIAILAPLVEEYEADMGEYPIRVGMPEGDSDRQLDLLKLLDGLSTFLVGLRHRCQVDCDLAGMRVAAEAIRRASRSPDSRSCLAELERILNTYRPVDVPGVRLASAAPPAVFNRFEEFLDDATYRAMSAEAADLGIPARAGRCLRQLRRLSQELLERGAFRSALSFGSTAASAAGLPLPDSELAASLLVGGYLPPVVDLSEAMRKALRAWRAQRDR